MSIVWGAPPPPAEVAARLRELRARLASIAGDRPVRIVAVTKGFGPAAVTAALAAGAGDVGENYAQELLAKADLLSGERRPAPMPLPAAGEGEDARWTGHGGCDLGAATWLGEPPSGRRGNDRQPLPVGQLGLRWHYLGAVQRRQVRRLAPLVALWHAVCRLEEGEAIGSAAPGASVLVQVRPPDGRDRRGVPASEVEALVGRLRGVAVVPVGLMVMGVTGDLLATRAAFRRVGVLARSLGLTELSMGMSADADVAVEEGATIVRVGRAVFGERPLKFHPLSSSPQ